MTTSPVRVAERQAAWLSTKGERRQRRLTEKRRAQLKLQGRSMGYMRQLKPGQRARVKAVKGRRGIEAANRTAERLAPVS